PRVRAGCLDPLTMSVLIPGTRGWLLAICVSRVGAYMVYIAYAATLPVLQREWQLSGTAAGSIASAFQVAYAVSLMGCSALADRIGARRVFVVGTVASAIVSLPRAGGSRGGAWVGRRRHRCLGDRLHRLRVACPRLLVRIGSVRPACPGPWRHVHHGHTPSPSAR